MRLRFTVLLFISLACFSQTLSPTTIWHTANTNGDVHSTGLSRDGRVLAFVGNGAPHISIRDLRKGRNRFIPIRGGCLFTWPIPSSRGRGIVYLCSTFNQEQILHVVGNDGSDRECYRRTAAYAILLQTTADESRVLVLIRVSDGSQQILLSDSTLAGRTAAAALSDDGGLLAFRRRIVSSPTESRIGVFVRILATQTDIPVNTSSSDSWCNIAGWTRERTLLYSCDRGPGSEIRRWQFDPSDNSKAEPVGIVQAHISPLGISQNGAFLFATYGETVDTYEVDVNRDTGRVTSQPRRINADNIGKSMYPLWFDGGRMISYVTFPSPHLVTKRFPDGPERNIQVDLRITGGPTWMADGTAVFVGIKEGVGEGYFRFHIGTGKTEPILLRSTEVGEVRGFPDFSADGNVAFYRNDQRHAVLARNLKDSTERVLYQAPGPLYGRIRSVHRSPDEKWVAFILNRQISNALMIVPASGGTALELYSARWPDQILEVQGFSWMPDSKRILFVRRSGERSELWSVSVELRRPHHTGFAVAGMRHLAVDPDGGRLAYAAGDQGMISIQSVELK
jgi:Tol biopolymer transport system component